MSTFDYRLDLAEDTETAALDLADESHEPFLEEEYDQVNFETTSYCDGSDDCSCGSCIVPAYGYDDGYEPVYGCDDSSEPGCGCDDYRSRVLESCVNAVDRRWNVGFEWTFLKPRYSENVAFTTMTGDGATTSTFTDTEFDYNLELAPRAWIEAPIGKNWSWRVSYWQFDQSPATSSTSPSAGGFGEITHPAFGDVDISTTLPDDLFTASSSLNVYTIDLEALKQSRQGDWQLGVGGGVRYASTDQSYSAQLLDTTNGNAVRGRIDYAHSLEGFGPTISLSGKRRLFRQVKLVCAARGSLLFGDGQSRLNALEDTTPANTVRLTNRDDLLPIGEARVGLEWLSPQKRRSWQWLLSTAMEGQIWGNAGNASSETADLGFFGFSIGAGWMR